MLRTKIVCTIGPASRDEHVLRAMMRAGMNVARINFSHGSRAEHRQDIDRIRKLAAEEKQLVAVLADLQGPKFRIGEVAGSGIFLKSGAQVRLTSKPKPDQASHVHVPHPELIESMKVGDRILIDDGLLELEAESVTGTDVLASVITGGLLRGQKGIALVGDDFAPPAITQKDLKDLALAVEQRVDYIAQSFVRTPEDVLELRQAMAELGANIPIIAKIEKAQALKSFDDILNASDAIMVARGDLGIEIPLSEVPIHQKRIIHAANTAAKPVITATQMLDSMTRHPRPTRAEVSDVANAVLDGTDAVMLSGETAIGQYPVEVVQTMAQIVERTESIFPFDQWFMEPRQRQTDSVTESISRATCEIACELGAAAIITTTRSGHTARAVASQRPATPILAMTPDPATYRQLALVWGVQPYLMEKALDTDEMIQKSIQKAAEENAVRSGDTIILTAGVPLDTALKTNMIQVQRIP